MNREQILLILKGILDTPGFHALGRDEILALRHAILDVEFLTSFGKRVDLDTPSRVEQT